MTFWLQRTRHSVTVNQVLVTKRNVGVKCQVGQGKSWKWKNRMSWAAAVQMMTAAVEGDLPVWFSMLETLWTTESSGLKGTESRDFPQIARYCQNPWCEEVVHKRSPCTRQNSCTEFPKRIFSGVFCQVSWSTGSLAAVQRGYCCFQFAPSPIALEPLFVAVQIFPENNALVILGAVLKFSFSLPLGALSCSCLLSVSLPTLM